MYTSNITNFSTVSRRFATGSQYDARVRRPFPAGRRLIAVDVENIAGGAHVSVDEAEAWLEALWCTADRTGNDVTVLGSGPVMAGTLAKLGYGRIALGRGLDGGERALLDCLEVSSVTGMYSSVYLASGDHLLAPAVAALRSAGVPTDVVARRGSVARALNDVCRSVSYLDVEQAEVAAA